MTAAWKDDVAIYQVVRAELAHCERALDDMRRILPRETQAVERLMRRIQNVEHEIKILVLGTDRCD